MEKVDFDDVTITFAPWVTLAKRNEMKDTIQSIDKDFEKIQFKTSAYYKFG